MVGHRRAQIALEFVVLYAIILIVFVLVFAVITSQRAVLLNTQEYSLLQLQAQEISSYINLAIGGGNGYSVSLALGGGAATGSYVLNISNTGVVILSSSSTGVPVSAYAFSAGRNMVINGILQYSTNSISVYTVPTYSGLLNISNFGGTIYIDTKPVSNLGLIGSEIPQSIKEGYVPVFNGKNSNITVQDTNALRLSRTYPNYTIALWLRANTLGPTEILGKGSGPSGYEIGIGPLGGSCAANQITVFKGSTSICLGSYPADNNWHQLVIVMGSGTSGGTYSYVDGALSGTGCGSCTSAISSNTAVLKLGVGSNAAYLNGEISNVQIYNNSLTTGQISSIYNEGLFGTPIESHNLTAWWPLNGNADDYSGNNQEGQTANVQFLTAAALNFSIIAHDGSQLSGNPIGIVINNGIVQGSGTSSLYYVPITLQNLNGATTTAFQQKISFLTSASYRAYVSTDLGNIRFFSSNSFTTPNELYSWCELWCNYTSTITNTTFWVNIGTLAANSNTVIYMVFEPSSGSSYEYDDNYAGECPTCSGSYGQYDNGAHVFNNYWDFSGTSLPSGWTGSGETVNSGISFPYPSNAYTTSNYGFATNSILEFYGKFPSATSANNGAFGFVEPGTGNAGVDAGWTINTNNNQGSTAYAVGQTATSSSYTTGINGGVSATGNNIWQIYFTPSYVNFSVNYGVPTKILTTVPTSQYPIGGVNYQGSQATVGSFTWTRVRTYPPNGIMPQQYLGALSYTTQSSVKNSNLGTSSSFQTSQSGIVGAVMLYNTISPNATVYAFNGNLSTSNSLIGWWPLTKGASIGNTIFDLSSTGDNGQGTNVIWNYSADEISILSSRFPSNPSNIASQNALITVNSTGSLQNVSTGGNATLISWVKIFGPESHCQGVFGSGGIASSGFMLYGNAISGHCSPAYVDQMTINAIQPLAGFGNWTMISLVMNAQSHEAYLYSNNALVGNTFIGTYSLTPGSGLYFIGADSSGGIDTLNGLIANTQLYSSALTPSQIKQLYVQGPSSIPLLNSKLSGWWPLNGNANDASGYGNSGTASGNVTWANSEYLFSHNSTIAQKIATFNSVTTVNVPFSSTLGIQAPLSIGFWMNGDLRYLNSDSETTSNTQQVFSSYFTQVPSPTGMYLNLCTECIPVLTYVGGGHYAINYLSGFQLTASSSYADTVLNSYGSSFNFTQKTWYYVMFTFGPSSVSTYINGINISYAQYAANEGVPVLLGSSSANLTIGGGFTGQIADMQVYKTVLTKTQVTQLYEQGLPPQYNAKLSIG